MERKKTKRLNVGAVAVGGGAPVSVQSMTNTDTRDARATAEQIKKLRLAGCDIVRVAVPDMEAARAVYEIKRETDMPVVADIHFDYRLALEAVSAGADKIRINPGNIGAPERVKAVAQACGSKGIPIRVGINGGSLEKALLAKYGGVTPQALVESALGQIRLLNRFDFDDICVSIKASSVPVTVEANLLMSQQADYPLHLGVTEAGTPRMGLLKSAAGIGGLLCMGIGDTIRVSLTADPAEEAEAGISLLKAVGLRKGGVELISCPTCGRCRVHMLPLVKQVEERLKDIPDSLTVAVMGCEVNGPGEASHADAGIACGEGGGLIFRGGRIVGRYPMDALVDGLMEQIENIRKERP